MKEIILKIDINEIGEQEVPALLIDGKHAIYSFANEGIVWFAPFVKIENDNVYKENSAIIIGRSQDKTMSHFEELAEKMKSMTLFEYFTTNEEVWTLDFDFELTKK